MYRVDVALLAEYEKGMSGLITGLEKYFDALF